MDMNKAILKVLKTMRLYDLGQRRAIKYFNIISLILEEQTGLKWEVGADMMQERFNDEIKASLSTKNDLSEYGKLNRNFDYKFTPDKLLSYIEENPNFTKKDLINHFSYFTFSNNECSLPTKI